MDELWIPDARSIEAVNINKNQQRLDTFLPGKLPEGELSILPPGLPFRELGQRGTVNFERSPSTDSSPES